MVAARVKVTLTILYLTGLLISNLLLLTKKQVYDLLKKGHITIRLIKRGKERHLVVISSPGRKILKSIITEIDLIGNEQENDEDPFLFAPINKKEPINSSPPDLILINNVIKF